MIRASLTCVLTATVFAAVLFVAASADEKQAESKTTAQPPCRLPVLDDDAAWQRLPKVEGDVAGRRLPIWAKALAGPLPRTTAAMLELDYLYRSSDAFDLSRLQVLYRSDRLSENKTRTVRSLARLAAECQRTRQRGYAVDDEEFDKGVRCIAAGVRDGTGQVVAAIGISAPASRLPEQRLAEIAQNVLQAAREISAARGHSHPPVERPRTKHKHRKEQA